MIIGGVKSRFNFCGGDGSFEFRLILSRIKMYGRVRILGLVGIVDDGGSASSRV